jgi:hypothetical protein
MTNNVQVAGAAIAATLALALGGVGCSSYLNDSQVTIKVMDKESVAVEGGHEYRVYTDTETYVMKDSIFKGRFRTSNDYAHLVTGQTYTCTAFGWRVPLFSMFENLRDCR